MSDFEACAAAETTTLLAAIMRLADLWGMSCGASSGAFRVLQVACLGNGSIHANELFRFDEQNRAAAFTVLRQALNYGPDAMPISADFRAALIDEQIRIGKQRGGRGNKE